MSHGARERDNLCQPLGPNRCFQRFAQRSVADQVEVVCDVATPEVTAGLDQDVEPFDRNQPPDPEEDVAFLWDSQPSPRFGLITWRESGDVHAARNYVYLVG